MFSTFTNQVSSLLGAKKPEADDNEQTKTEIVNQESAEDTQASEKIASPTKGAEKTENGKPPEQDGGEAKAGGRLEMFANMKNQVSSQVSSFSTWLGSKKGQEGQAAPAETAKTESKPESPLSEKSVKGSSGDGEKADDDSSVTSGADTDPPSSPPLTPTEGEGEAGKSLEGVQNKAILGAKSFGNFLFTAVNKAGAKVSEAGAKIKKTVEENSILGDFNKEQNEFIKENQGKEAGEAVPPWVGSTDEAALKEQIMSLSTDRRNFVRSPPSGVEFNFDYNTMHPIAMATLKEDTNLEKMRFDLVPKVINEETFWRNYFYRVSLIKQSDELSSLAQVGSRDSKDSSRGSSLEDKGKDDMVPDHSDSPTQEFASDDFRASSKDMEDVRAGMRKLGMEKKA